MIVTQVLCMFTLFVMNHWLCLLVDDTSRPASLLTTRRSITNVLIGICTGGSLDI